MKIKKKQQQLQNWRVIERDVGSRNNDVKKENTNHNNGKDVIVRHQRKPRH